MKWGPAKRREGVWALWWDVGPLFRHLGAGKGAIEWRERVGSPCCGPAVDISCQPALRALLAVAKRPLLPTLSSANLAMGVSITGEQEGIQGPAARETVACAMREWFPPLPAPAAGGSGGVSPLTMLLLLPPARPPPAPRVLRVAGEGLRPRAIAASAAASAASTSASTSSTDAGAAAGAAVPPSPPPAMPGSSSSCNTDRGGSSAALS